MSASARDLAPRLSLRANFSWTFVGNSVNALSWFSMTAVLAKLGSPEHVGQFALGLATTAPIFMFATLRLRDVQATDTRGQYRFEHYFALRLITTLLAVLAVVVIVVVADFAHETRLVILATAVSKSIEAVSDAFYGRFMQRERLDRIAKSMMIKGPLSLLGLVLGFYLTGSVFWGVLGLAAGRAAIMLGYDLRNVSLSLKPSTKFILGIIPAPIPRPRWEMPVLARLTWMVLPLGAVTMLISFNSNVPRYFIQQYMGEYQLGIFAAIAAFQKAAPTVVQALGRSASPRLANYYADHKSWAFRRLTRRLIAIGAFLGAAGVAVALIAGRPILTLFYGTEYALPGLFALVMLGAGLDYVATMVLFVITAARYFRIQLPLQVLTTGTVTIVSYWLIPRLGLPGAAMALVAGNLVRMLCTMAAAWHAQRALQRKSFSASPLLTETGTD